MTLLVVCREQSMQRSACSMRWAISSLRSKIDLPVKRDHVIRSRFQNKSLKADVKSTRTNNPNQSTSHRGYFISHREWRAIARQPHIASIRFGASAVALRSSVNAMPRKQCENGCLTKGGYPAQYADVFNDRKLCRKCYNHEKDQSDLQTLWSNARNACAGDAGDSGDSGDAGAGDRRCAGRSATIFATIFAAGR